MPFWKPSKKESTEDENDYLLADWNPPSEPVPLDNSMFDSEPSELFKTIERQVNELKIGNKEIIPLFIDNLKKIHSSESENMGGSFNQFAFFSSQLMEEDGFNLYEQDWLFQNDSFIKGILKLLDYELHYLCWLLIVGKYSRQTLQNMIKAAKKSSYGLDCEECGQAGWWSDGLILNYFMIQENLASKDIEEIYDLAQNENDDLLYLGIARHANTPKKILQELAKMDLDVTTSLEHPWANGMEFTENIAHVSLKNLEKDKT